MPVRSLMLCLLLCASVARGAPPLRVVDPATESRDDTRFDDLKEILRTALDETAGDDGPYTLGASSRYVNEARYLAEIRDGGGEANVVWSSTSEQKERELLPIRFELRKGLLGYRVALIDRRRQADFDRVATFAELKKLTLGQGIGWGDVAVYQAAGIRVSTAPYDDLFRMVANDRFDLFPRGVGEAFREHAASLLMLDGPAARVETLADDLGLTLETVSRARSKLHAYGALNFLGSNQREIMLVDRDQLAALDT